jgi:hypothetical protein
MTSVKQDEAQGNKQKERFGMHQDRARDAHPPLGIQLRVAQDLDHDRRAVPRGAAEHRPDHLRAV